MTNLYQNNTQFGWTNVKLVCHLQGLLNYPDSIHCIGTAGAGKAAARLTNAAGMKGLAGLAANARHAVSYTGVSGRLASSAGAAALSAQPCSMLGPHHPSNQAGLRPM